MARAALKWTGADLAEASGVGTATIARFELGKDITLENRVKLAKALEAAGAQFSKKAGRVVVSVPEIRGD